MHTQLLNMAYTVTKAAENPKVWICAKCSNELADIRLVKELSEEGVCMSCGDYGKIILYEKLRTF